MFPRGGGIHDQDPILIRDFRIIRNAEREWKQVNEQMSEMKGGGDPLGMQGAMDNYLEQLGESGSF